MHPSYNFTANCDTCGEQAVSEAASANGVTTCYGCILGQSRQQAERRNDEIRTGQQHEEILAGLAGERAHSRFYDANGQPVQWTYKGDGSML